MCFKIFFRTYNEITTTNNGGERMKHTQEIFYNDMVTILYAVHSLKTS